MGRPKSHKVLERASPPAPQLMPGDVPFKVTKPDDHGVAVILPPTNKPPIKLADMQSQGWLKLNREYAMKKESGVSLAKVVSRNTDANGIRFVKFQKGFAQPDHSIKWSPIVSAVEKNVEDWIDKFKIPEEETK